MTTLTNKYLVTFTTVVKKQFDLSGNSIQIETAEIITLQVPDNATPEFFTDSFISAAPIAEKKLKDQGFVCTPLMFKSVSLIDSRLTLQTAN